jgi:hypothetical protein
MRLSLSIPRGTLLASVLVLGVLIVLGGLLYREVLRVQHAANRMVTSCHYKCMACALHNYQDAHGHFPPQAICSPEGKPLLSWRVAILPYIEEEKLYKQFHLDEPWDSPHNLALLPRMPRAYRRPEQERGALLERTHYQVIIGDKLLFDPEPGRRLPWDPFKPNLAHMVFMVDAREAVPWTAPMDLDADDGRPLLPRLDGRFGGYVVNRADGGSLKLPLDLSEAEFRVMLGR